MFLAMQSAAVGAHTLTPGRLVATIASLVALSGLVIGALAMRRADSGTARRWAIVGLASGLTGMAVGGVVVALAKGGPGTGYGVVGGWAALAVGFVAAAVGWLAFGRARRANSRALPNEMSEGGGSVAYVNARHERQPGGNR